MHSGTRLRCSLRSEASHPRQLEVLIAAVKFIEANWPLKMRISLFTMKGLLIRGLDQGNIHLDSGGFCSWLVSVKT